MKASEAWNLDELGATLNRAWGTRRGAARYSTTRFASTGKAASRRSEAIVLFRLGHLFRDEGDCRFLPAASTPNPPHILIEMDLPAELVDVAEGLAALETQAERPESAARLCGAIGAFRQSQNAPDASGEPDACDPFGLRVILGEAKFAEWYAAGGTQTLAQAAQSVLRGSGE